jgi:hypothetical protein
LRYTPACRSKRSRCSGGVECASHARGGRVPSHSGSDASRGRPHRRPPRSSQRPLCPVGRLPLLRRTSYFCLLGGAQVHQAAAASGSAVWTRTHQLSAPSVPRFAALSDLPHTVSPGAVRGGRAASKRNSQSSWRAHRWQVYAASLGPDGWRTPACPSTGGLTVCGSAAGGAAGGILVLIRGLRTVVWDLK